MSAVEADEHPHEIIIVRHAHGDHDEAHHGGVWKIAFADFMTAMMCFFLVMWLISAANEQTKAAVASYFNPVKLIDRNSSRKGLEDIGDGPNAIGDESEKPQTLDATTRTEGQGKGGAEQIPNSQDAKAEKKYSDEHLFADPYAVLAEIAANTGVEQNISPKGDGGAQTCRPGDGRVGRRILPRSVRAGFLDQAGRGAGRNRGKPPDGDRRKPDDGYPQERGCGSGQESRRRESRSCEEGGCCRRRGETCRDGERRRRTRCPGCAQA